MPAIDRLLQAALKNQVDAVLLEPGRLPRFRKNGADQEVTQQPLDARAIERLLAEVAPMGRLPEAASSPRWEFDHELDGRTIHFACLATSNGWTALVSLALVGDGAASPPAVRAPLPPPVAGSKLAGIDKSRKPLPSIEVLLRSMLELGASDLHLAAYEPPSLRLNGELQPFETYAAATSAQLKELLLEITPERQRGVFERTNDAAFTHEIQDLARFRVLLRRDQMGVGAAIRHVPLEVPSATALDLPVAAEHLVAPRHGLALVCGPSSSGKSTTLAALLDLANSRRRCLILTLESPVEFVHARKRALVRQREIPTHAPSVAEALRSARTEDADIVMIGDLHSREDVAEALELAAAGTLVLAGVRAATIRDGLAALVESQSIERRARARELLASSFRGALGQILLPRAEGGRIAAREVLLAHPVVSNLVREDRFHLLATAQSRSSGGGVTQIEVLAELVGLKLVSARDAVRAAADREGLLERLRVVDPSGKLLRELETGA